MKMTKILKTELEVWSGLGQNPPYGFEFWVTRNALDMATIYVPLGSNGEWRLHK